MLLLKMLLFHDSNLLSVLSIARILTMSVHHLAQIIRFVSRRDIVYNYSIKNDYTGLSHVKIGYTSYDYSMFLGLHQVLHE
jgi:hypothetical protein